LINIYQRCVSISDKGIIIYTIKR